MTCLESNLFSQDFLGKYLPEAWISQLFTRSQEMTFYRSWKPLQKISRNSSWFKIKLFYIKMFQQSKLGVFHAQNQVILLLIALKSTNLLIDSFIRWRIISPETWRGCLTRGNKSLNLSHGNFNHKTIQEYYF